LALTLFIVVGLVSMLYLEPLFDELKASGYRDEIDPALQKRVATWYTADWAVWSAALVGGLALLLALIRPATTPKQVAVSSPQDAAIIAPNGKVISQ
jgi:hypothetical protein